MILSTTHDGTPRGSEGGHPSCEEYVLRVRLDLSEIERFLILKYKTGGDALVVVDPETGLPRPVSIKEAMAGATIRCRNLEELRRTEQEVRKSAESLRTFLLLAVAASGCERASPTPE
jgi:hypothetical protein